jgi:hypothetical protein
MDDQRMGSRPMGPEALLIRDRQLRIREGPLGHHLRRNLSWVAVILAGVVLLLIVVHAYVPSPSPPPNLPR